MDPNETLLKIRQAFTEIDDYRDDRMVSPDVLEALANAGRVLTESCEALSEWLAKGGFLPSEYS